MSIANLTVAVKKGKGEVPRVVFFDQIVRHMVLWKSKIEVSYYYKFKHII